MRQRAQPLLGTTVLIRLEAGDDALANAAFDAAFAVVRHIGQVMSAHHPESDLGRLARAQAGQELALDPHTVAVLRLARHWHRESAGAFNPVRAAQVLGQTGQRPAFAGLSSAPVGHWKWLEFLGNDCVRVAGPLWLDLGGIAKGYAVDQAIAALQAHGVRKALVNAGGDMRSIGTTRWPVQVRHNELASAKTGLQGLRRLRTAALATSASRGVDTALVRPTSRRSHPLGGRWSQCTVAAPDCVTADALTKWGLLARPGAMRLQRVLRGSGARMWRTP